MAEELQLHWVQSVPMDGEVLTEVVGNMIRVEGWAPGAPPPEPVTSGTATWVQDGTRVEMDWQYDGELHVLAVRVTVPEPVPLEGRVAYQAGSTRVEVAYRVENGAVTLTDADVMLLAGVD